MTKRRHVMIVISDDDDEPDPNEEDDARIHHQRQSQAAEPARKKKRTSEKEHKYFGLNLETTPIRKPTFPCTDTKEQKYFGLNLETTPVRKPTFPCTDTKTKPLDLKHQSKQPWSEKHSPKQISDLAVHSKKVAAVREWLEEKLRNARKLPSGGNVLVLSGPTGAGKTATVRVLVELLDCELCEWDPPVPTLWKEHLHHVNPDVPYMSKMSEFLSFLEKVKKYPLLPLLRPDEPLYARQTSTVKPKVLLLDDLPMVHGMEQASMLCQSLHNFAMSVQFPTIVIMTEYHETEENKQVLSSLTANIEQTLENAGALKIVFNPITANSVKKTLSRILTAEKCSVPSGVVDFISESCGGDIRHAICSLQFNCLGQESSLSIWDPGGNRSLPKRKKIFKGAHDRNSSKGRDLTSSQDVNASFGYRDGVLSLFHALGKVLYNKRLTENSKDSGKSSINLILKDHLQRHPLNMEAPEILLSQCHAESGSFLSFLDENLLDFIDSEGIEDASISMSYFSDADCLLGGKYKGSRSSSHKSSDEVDPGHIAEAVSGSIAARGALFANTHPEKHRWQAIRAPAMRQVYQQLNKKKVELQAKSLGCFSQSGIMVTGIVQATEYEPFYKRLIPSSNYFDLHPQNQQPSKQMLDVDMGLSEYENDFSLTSSQESNLVSDVMAMDVYRTNHHLHPNESNDDIEEW